jgi:NAD(P)-dependent dehydrogenase (short-subunit alcohol dehydrogenase family)
MIWKRSLVFSTTVANRLFFSTTTTSAFAMDTSKKCCVVVGLGKGGIGDSIAKKFSQEGYNVAMIARSDLSRLEGDIPNSKSYQCDATDPEQIFSTVEAIRNDMGGKIDAVMYNAGSGVFKPFADTSHEEYMLAMKTGPSGLFLFTKACVDHMPVDGSIGVTGATASWRGMPYTAAFASSKMATRGLCQALARDLGPSKGIHVFHVVIDGIVKLPGNTSDKKDNEMLDPTKIAETYFQMSQQPQTCWTQEIHVGAGGAFGNIASI